MSVAPAAVGRVVLTLLRVGLGTLMVMAGSSKIDDPQSFAVAIKAFELIDAERAGWLIIALAFLIPWLETIAGALLIVGSRTRLAAGVVAVLLAVFLAGLVAVLASGRDVSCPCFGGMDLFCSGPISVCHIVRNSGLIIAGLVLCVAGPGLLAVDPPARDPRDDDGLGGPLDERSAG